jgi:hypothetical protein
VLYLLNKAGVTAASSWEEMTDTEHSGDDRRQGLTEPEFLLGFCTHCFRLDTLCNQTNTLDTNEMPVSRSISQQQQSCASDQLTDEEDIKVKLTRTDA